MSVDSLFARARAPTFATVATVVMLLYASLFAAPASAAPNEIAALDANSILITVQRNHGEADTMLDSVRDDVYKAVLLGTRGNTEHIQEVQKEFAEHAKNLKTRIEANSELGIDQSLRSSLQALQQSLDAYIRSAEDLIAVAGDHEKAVPKLDGFQNVYEALGKTMRTFSDMIDAQVWQRQQATAQNSRFHPAVVGITLLGLSILIAFLFSSRRSPASARTPPDLVR
jgi:Skp family chaperone for outer membrane proteins